MNELAELTPEERRAYQFLQRGGDVLPEQLLAHMNEEANRRARLLRPFLRYSVKQVRKLVEGLMAKRKGVQEIAIMRLDRGMTVAGTAYRKVAFED